MKTMIFGAGSLGTVLGAYLSKNGEDVTLVTRNREHVDALNKTGAHVTGTVEMTVPVKAVTPDEIEGKFDLIILLTKQPGNEKILQSLKPNMNDCCQVCTLQNGLPEMSVASVVGEKNTMGAAVAWGATLLGKGTSELTSDPDSMSFSLGRMDGSEDEKLHEVKSVLEKMCPVEIDKNFIGARWSKLLINCAFSGMSAVTGGTFGDAANEKGSRKCCQALIKECIDIAEMSGVKIEPVQGKDIVKLLYYKGKGIKKAFSFAIIPLCMKKHALLKASMLQDLEKGKKCEVEAINGAVVAQAERLGVKAPFNARVCAIIHGIEDGKYKPCFENVRLFDDLL